MRIIGLYDIDEHIKVNGTKEVTSPTITGTGSNQFNPNGLFSEEIFGQTDDERKYTCGYIKLPIFVFNPEIAKTIITRSGGIIRKMAYGDVRCNLVDGKLIAADNGQYCGLKDLYKIWDEIDVAKTLNTKRTENIEILTKTPKRLLFNDKVLVLPPAMRPTGMRNGRPVKSELNSIYIRLLGLKSVTSHTTADVYKVYNQIQDAVIDIYTYIHKICGTKNGYLQKNLLAKNTVATVRDVISAPSYRSNNPEVGIYRTGYPLMALVSMFQPFMKFQLKQFLSYDNIAMIHSNPDEIKRSDIDNIYDDRAIDEMLRIFMQNPGSRFKILYMDPENQKPIMFNAVNLKTKETISRPLTLTDAMYIACYSVTVDANRHVYTVRYPIGDYLGAFFTRIHVLSTNNTMPIEFQGKQYKTYPIVDPNMSHSQVSTQFIDVVQMSNSRLSNLGGDYDGDTVKSTGIWSDEGNEEAERLMTSKIYNVRTDLTAAYPIAIECLNGLYGLTKQVKKSS